MTSTNQAPARRVTIPRTDLQIYPLCLGGNVFGWSADENESFAVLDAFYEAGGNFIDTADMYSHWKEGNKGGESETIIGKWMNSRGNRSQIIIATKVAKLPTRPGLSRENIQAAAADSLSRLQTDYIDLYYSHEDDPKTPQLETAIAFDALVKAGKVRYLGASNFTAERLLSADEIAKSNSLTQYIALQNHYNILERKAYEQELLPAVEKLKISSIPYFGLARGFLTGKYRRGVEVQSVRAGGVKDLLTDRNFAILEKLDEIAKTHNSPLAPIALAWLRSRPTVIAPIASARTVDQLQEITPIVELRKEEIQALNSISD